MNAGPEALSQSPGIESPIRVYVGSQEAQMLAVKVLEFSIRKHASMPVEVFPLHEARVEFPMPRDPRNRPRTPFSFQRFYIPMLAGYAGRAIYLDSDMQVFKDIRALWSLPFNGADLLAVGEPGASNRRPQFSVMLLDCGALRWELPKIVEALDRGELTYETLMYEMAVAKRVHATIDPSWNSLERYVEASTALLHYTDMPTQPWVSRQNAHGHLWVRDLMQAVREGSITRDYIAEHVARGYVRPSLLVQIEEGIEDAAALPNAAHARDARFVPPFRQGGGNGTLTGRLRSVLRRVFGSKGASASGHSAAGGSGH